GAVAAPPPAGHGPPIRSICVYSAPRLASARGRRSTRAAERPRLRVQECPLSSAGFAGAIEGGGSEGGRSPPPRSEGVGGGGDSFQVRVSVGAEAAEIEVGVVLDPA